MKKSLKIVLAPLGKMFYLQIIILGINNLDYNSYNKLQAEHFNRVLHILELFSPWKTAINIVLNVSKKLFEILV